MRSVCGAWVGRWIAAFVLGVMPAAVDAVGADWPQWRGPLGTGVAPDGAPPVEWSETRNVRWKTAIAGKGHSTPIIWRDRIFLTTAIPTGERLPSTGKDRPGAHDNAPVTHRQECVVLALNRATGDILWHNIVHEEVPVEGGHVTSSFASASPVTDGEHVIAYFGSFGLFCLDLDGNLVWKTDLGQMHTKHGHGEGSSPALHGDTVVVNWDHEEESFVAAFDKRTGKRLWKTTRDDEATSWSTPIIVEHAGKPQVIVPGTTRMRGYDLADGKVLWECGGLSANICATPVHHDGIVIAGSSYVKRGMIGVKLEGARGDITNTPSRLWFRKRGTPYVPSLLLYDDVVYFLAHYQNILSRAKIRTGADDGGPFRLSGIGNVYSSPVGAAGRIYVSDLEGRTIVMTHAREPQTLALNRLDEPISASAAIAGDELYLRGETHLYCIAEDAREAKAGSAAAPAAAPADDSGLKISDIVNTERMRKMLGDGWKRDLGIVLESEAELAGLKGAERETGEMLFGIMKPIGVVACSEFSFSRTEPPLNNMTLKVFRFESIDKAEEYRKLKYERAEAKPLYRKSEIRGKGCPFFPWRTAHEGRDDVLTVLYDSLQVPKRIVFHDVFWITCGQLAKNDRHARVLDACVLRGVDSMTGTSGARLALGRDDLIRVCKAIATLDAILSPDWDDRYYSFDSKWDADELHASMRDGSGNRWHAHFTPAGVIVFGLAHESPAFRADEPLAGILDQVPPAFASSVAEPAFDTRNISFCTWKLEGGKWQHGGVGAVDDGASELLAILDGNPATYQSYAREYFEVDVPLEAIAAVYAQQPLTAELLASIRSDADFAEIEKDLREIGYPVSMK